MGVNNNNKKKYETLGMPHGTASNRLRKSLLFKYVKKAGDNFCFKCGGEIESVDTLSIDHKNPWEGVSADLFFNLDNIAFSHISCNRPDRRYRKFTKGNRWCRSCQQEYPEVNFYRNKSKPSGFQDVCKSCSYEQMNIRRLRR